MPIITSCTNKNTEHRQAGFGLIEVALVLIVVSLLGATGWYALRSKDRTDKILNGAAAESDQTKAAAQGGIKYRVNLPTDLKTQIQTFYNNFKSTCAIVAPGPVVFDVLKNVKDQQIQVKETCGGVGGSHIYVLQSGKLVDAAISSGTYACTDVDQYKISSQLASNCYVSNLDGSQTLRTNTNP
ncbi:MAG TPA: hypothetical protein VFH37_02575 [Candidatus Saccharimonadales bacterium]|nr:hypothetical protein [Candidatus Saccharimonadales bacterium]